MSIPNITPSRTLTGEVDGLFVADAGGFVTRSVDQISATLDGIDGDSHAGISRQSGGREPWYPRGTQLRNERQITILCRDELRSVASEMDIATVAPEWIGGNMTLAGIPMLSMLPASTLLFFEGGVTIKVDFQNGPCKIAGASIAKHIGRDGDAGLALSFGPAAKRRRGLIAWVEKPGTIKRGEAVKARLPEQWIYSAG